MAERHKSVNINIGGQTQPKIFASGRRREKQKQVVKRQFQRVMSRMGSNHQLSHEWIRNMGQRLSLKELAALLHGLFSSLVVGLMYYGFENRLLCGL